jgi:hypothetical protein
MASAFSSISSGNFHTCGILTNYSVYCWGGNDNGQLGDGTIIQRYNPTAVNKTSTFSSISLGVFHTCGILMNGSAYCWGYNYYGRLGDGTTTQRLNPTAVNISSNFTSISSGTYHTCGILTNGSAYCWGYNANGRLGDGTSTQRYNPTAVSMASAFSSISSGNDHTCGILTNEKAICWGSNENSQLGIPDTGLRYNPSKVIRGIALGESTASLAIASTFDNEIIVYVGMQKTPITLSSGWHHLAVSYNFNTGTNIYADGVLAAQDSISIVPWQNTGFLIGEVTKGSLDEVKIFNRALSSQQVHQEYLAGIRNTTSNSLASNELAPDDEWICSVTPNDGYVDG